MERELRAEVGDRPAQVAAQAILAIADVVVQAVDHGRGVGREAAVGGQRRPSLGIGLAEQADRVARAGPCLRIDPREEALRLGMPRPPQVLGQLAEAVQARRVGQVGAVEGGNSDGRGHRRRMISVRDAPRRFVTRYATDPPDGQLLGQRDGGCPRHPGGARLGASGSRRPCRVNRGWRRYARHPARSAHARRRNGACPGCVSPRPGTHAGRHRRERWPWRNGGNGDSHGEQTPFRELLTEFRNLTERYGQALLALGESRGEVAALRGRVDLLEARIDHRLPWTEAPPAGWNAEALPEPERAEEPEASGRARSHGRAPGRGRAAGGGRSGGSGRTGGG